MSENKGLMDDVNDGVRLTLGRLGEFFHIFDLSFFVAGSVSFGAMCFLFIKMNWTGSTPFAPWVEVLALLLTCYTCGLMCFSLGRFLNGK